eukprot:3877663-Rhodomonas_salina.1
MCIRDSPLSLPPSASFDPSLSSFYHKSSVHLVRPPYLSSLPPPSPLPASSLCRHFSQRRTKSRGQMREAESHSLARHVPTHAHRSTLTRDDGSDPPRLSNLRDTAQMSEKSQVFLRLSRTTTVVLFAVSCAGWPRLRQPDRSASLGQVHAFYVSTMSPTRGFSVPAGDGLAHLAGELLGKGR